MNLKRSRLLLLMFVTMSGLVLSLAVLALAGRASSRAYAAPIPPPDGYPKFNQSWMTVAPQLAPVGSATLTYTIAVVNTGAYQAANVTVTDVLPGDVDYNNDGTASAGQIAFANGTLTWTGPVAFDATVYIRFSVKVHPAYQGPIVNQASIQHASLASPIVVSAETLVTDDPFFEITKTSAPAIPGPDKPMTYTLTVTNRGQTATNLPVTVSDHLPVGTSFLSAGPDGSYDTGSKTVTWQRQVSLTTDELDDFSFSVLVNNNVVSGTIISNDQYQVSNMLSGVATGEPYTVEVKDPVLFIYKDTNPFPPGSNQPMTYTLTVLNKGSLATDLQIQDTIPAGVTYLRGGTKNGNKVSWTVPRLDTGESVQVSFTVYVDDVAEVQVLNDVYQVCSAEGPCQDGIPLTSIIKGPTFAATAELYPLAKKPGGGGGPVTPTLTIANLGPGNALDASALLYFYNISVSNPKDLDVIPLTGTLTSGPYCGSQCKSFHWIGDIHAGEMVTFTTEEGQSTIGGGEGSHVTATVVISDLLSGFAYQPITATAVSTITHFANLLPVKSAPPVIAPGQVMTYSLKVWNSGLSTDTPPYPVLTDDVPAGVTVKSVSDGGQLGGVTDQELVTWTLPSMGPGDIVYRSYAVQVDPDLISGTLIVNDNYRTIWNDVGATITETYVLSNTGQPVTTKVKEIGLVDLSKTVTPTWSLPGAVQCPDLCRACGQYQPGAVIRGAAARPVPLAEQHLPAGCGRHQRAGDQRYRQPGLDRQRRAIFGRADHFYGDGRFRLQGDDHQHGGDHP